MKIVEDALNWARKQACFQLHIPHIEAHYSLEFFDEQGNLTRVREGRSKSWVRNGYNIALVTLTSYPHTGGYSAGNTSWRQTTSTVMTLMPASDDNCINYSTGYRINVRADTGQILWGIVVGSSNSAENFNGYDLVSKLSHGYGAGLVSYQRQNLYAQSYDSGAKKMTGSHTRYFNNNSDGDITLGEIGLIFTRYYAPSHTAYRYYGMMCRDILDPAETFLDKAQLKVTYSVSLTYPS